MKNILNRTKVVILAIMALVLFSACTPKKTVQVQGDVNKENTIKITVTFYPLYVLLSNITDGIEGVELSVLAPADTGCLHDYQLTTKDMKKIEDCDILVANGSGMEDFIEKILSTKKDSLILATEGFGLVDNNSHVWVSPQGAIYETQKIVEGLVHLNPENAAKYVQNGNAYLAKLEELTKYMHSMLDEYKGKKIVTFHEAFPYFASEFGLEIASVIEREPGEVPGPKELKEQIEEINSILAAGNKIALFAEPQYSSKAAEIIAKETGLKVYELDPCVTGDFNSATLKDSYIINMKKNAEVLKEALAD
ncbi:MAG: metal ABC transporter substrate-binding protein [Treponema sp.]|nr:metal ABC transporter substrate-binding protein [Spirochaetia bacterium]MDD7459599.1 metal ABC transporter substrate-binding protein [Spirochaetales bacterium]MDY5810941.1 metal ABC transporter substrate-binding protein [Treponema sp.]MEE1181993.1 metal ABC transporter substrate-binding protein [Treponema sp.]